MLSTKTKPTVSDKPDSSPDVTARINEALEQNDFETAYDGLLELSRLTPDSTQIETTAGLVALQLEKQGEACSHFARALHLSPDDLVANYNMALTEMQYERYDLALERLRHLRRLDPSNVNIINDVGVVYLQKNQPSRALASFSRVMKLDPEHSQARNNAMELCFNAGLFDRAAKMLDAQLRQGILTPKSQVEIGQWQKLVNDAGALESGEGTPD